MTVSVDQDGKQAHGVEEVVWDCIGEGWRVACLCGWTSAPDEMLRDAGAEFDDHVSEEKDAAEDE